MHKIIQILDYNNCRNVILSKQLKNNISFMNKDEIDEMVSGALLPVFERFVEIYRFNLRRQNMKQQ